MEIGIVIISKIVLGINKLKKFNTIKEITLIPMKCYNEFQYYMEGGVKCEV